LGNSSPGRENVLSNAAVCKRKAATESAFGLAASFDGCLPGWLQAAAQVIVSMANIVFNPFILVVINLFVIKLA
jgi:hypothetical protein